MKQISILIVEDDDAALYGYKRFFTKNNFEITSVKSLKAAKDAVANFTFDIVLLDLKLSDGDAIGWIPEYKKSNPGTPIIVITANSDITVAVKAIKFGAENFLLKPVEMNGLKIVIEKCLEIESLRKRDLVSQRVATKVNSFFGSNPLTIQTLEYASIAASSQTVVLLLGETGTGKGLLAKWIHDHSERKDKPFVEVNCSSLKGELLRSELFGHARGAFTSAIKDKEGLLEVADGGTLFLDEIGEMDIDVQALLLKTIEEKSFRRLGENAVRKSDFRLLCATNRDLLDNKQIAFRKDLYYRICVFPIHLPELRAKKDEIPGLCDYMLKSMSYTHESIDSSILNALMHYSWPGNARELRNMLERALMLAQGKPLTLNHFPGLTSKDAVSSNSSKSHKLRDIESAHISLVIDEYDGNMIKASEALGLCVSSLYRRIGKKVK